VRLVTLLNKLMDLGFLHDFDESNQKCFPVKISLY
jgi:hypothetical protein